MKISVMIHELNVYVNASAATPTSSTDIAAEPAEGAPKTLKMLAYEAALRVAEKRIHEQSWSTGPTESAAAVVKAATEAMKAIS